jgi:N-acetylglutamate synthase-like GNAT family acetyltransferase
MSAAAAVVQALPLRRAQTAVVPASTGAAAIRSASAADAPAIHALIAAHVEEGHLLPRDAGEILVHAPRFVVVADGERLVACADLAPLSRTVAEIRSLVVSRAARAEGLGRRIIDELIRRAAVAGFEKLCAFTHAPGYFVQFGFSIVPHVWVPEKIETDCRACSQFRRCGQYAVRLELTRARHSCVPLGSLHG